MAKIKCFISYCHEDVDRDAFDYMLFQIEKYSDGKIDIISDKTLRYGSNFESFMANIDEVSTIIIIYSPSYKTKVINRIDGVEFEYNKILARHYDEENRLKEDYNSERKFTIIPMLFSGSHKSSVPEDLDKIKYADLTRFRVSRNKNGHVFASTQIEKEFHPLFKKIASEIITADVYADYSYSKAQDVLHEQLFRNLKADWIDLDDQERDKQNHIFVKTHAYKRIKDQTVTILVGRKGSGKSTVTQQIAFNSGDKYKYHSPMDADKVQLQYIFDLFEEPQANSDIKNIFSISRSFRYSWELFIYLYCMNVIAKEYIENKISDERKSDAEVVKNFVFKILQDPDHIDFMDNSAAFIYSLNKLNMFTRHCIQTSRNDEEFFRSDIVSKFTICNFLDFSLGPDVIDSFNRVIKGCKKRILFSLDRFDNAFIEYRKSNLFLQRNNPELFDQRVTYEIYWLTSLLHTILRMKSNHERVPLYSLLDFCISIPQDRFMEIRGKERDSYIFSGRYSPLKWSAPELAIMLRKRLEVLAGNYTDKNGNNFIERLHEIIRTDYPTIPRLTLTNIGDSTYELDIFIDVLRHTFWKPREILWYFRNIIATATEFKRRQLRIDNNVVRKTISDTTRRVIVSEFIPEYNLTLLNLEEVLDVFRGAFNYLSFKQLSNLLEKISFKFVYSVDPEHSIKTKISTLYDLGFLGINANKTVSDRYSFKCKHSFTFNEKNTLDDVAISELECFEYVIHPIFYEFLNIQANDEELVLHYDWQYLKKNEAFLFASL